MNNHNKHSDSENNNFSHEQLRTLGEVVDISSIEVFIFRKNDLKFVYLNEGALNKIGYPLEQALQMTPLDIKLEYNLTAFRQMLKQVEASGSQGLVFQTTHQTISGDSYPVEVKIQLLSWEDQPAFVVFASDISKRQQIETELKESEQKFKEIAETIDAGIFIYTDHYQYVNPAFSKITGFSEEDAKQMYPWDGLEPELQERIKPIIKRRLLGESFPQHYQDLRFITKQGLPKWIRANTQTITYRGQFAGLGCITDITDLRETQEQLKLFSHVIEQTDDLVRITDPEGLITYANPAFYKFTGYSENEIIGKNNRILKSGKMSKDFYEQLWKTITGGKSFQGTFINRKKRGEIYYEQQTITPLLDQTGTIEYFVSTSKDITDRVLLEQRNEQLAKTDKLTGASNRHRGDEFLSTSTDYAHIHNIPLSVILIDIDYFKSINDEYGHQSGDEALVHLSQLINAQLRQTDLFVRWGGEEFLIISTHTDLEQADVLAERIRSKIDQDQFKDYKQLTISCGVTQLKENENTEQLIKRADKALYQAKQQGRNQVVSAN